MSAKQFLSSSASSARRPITSFDLMGQGPITPLGMEWLRRLNNRKHSIEDGELIKPTPPKKKYTKMPSKPIPPKKEKCAKGRLSKFGAFIRGERVVGPGGRIYVAGHRLRHDKLKPWIGKRVFVRVDPRSSIHLIVSHVEQPSKIICRAEVFLRHALWYVKSPGFRGVVKS